jgi:long-chain acyl-CoA synthetase
MKTAILGSILNHAYAHESRRPEQVWLTQPVGGGHVVDITWRQALDQARRMAAHLQARGLERGERVAMLAGNSAHFAIAELAIWIAGGTTVAVLPTETNEHIRGVLEDCEARVLFVGKLDDWERQRRAIPARLPCIALPLAPSPFEAASAASAAPAPFAPSAPSALSTLSAPRPAAPSATDPASGCRGNEWLIWDDIVARTPPLEGRPGRCTDEVAMIVYASGSSGGLQRVMHTFGSITRVAQALVDEQVERDGRQRLPGRMLSHLPLAQYFERTRLLCSALVSGRTQIFFGQRRATFFEDMKRARPTLLLAAPQLWIEWQQAVLARLPAAQLDALLANPATAPATRAQVLESLGLDAVQRVVTGPGPQPAEVLAWWRRLGLNPDYAMTEDFVCPDHTVREDATAAVGARGAAQPENALVPSEFERSSGVVALRPGAVQAATAAPFSPVRLALGR